MTFRRINFRGIYCIVLILSSILASCGEQTYDKQQTSGKADTIKRKTILIHYPNSYHTSEFDECAAQFELKDSLLQLTRIKDQFYRSKTGHLYERTVGLKEVDDHLNQNEYFNGNISQEVDPLSFEPLDGWYAKDKSYVYYYRPLSGGMQILKMDTADTKTFKMIVGHYRYALDKNFFYDEFEIIGGFVPGRTKLKHDATGRVTEMTCNHKKFKFQLVN